MVRDKSAAGAAISRKVYRFHAQLSCLFENGGSLRPPGRLKPRIIFLTTTASRPCVALKLFLCFRVQPMTLFFGSRIDTLVDSPKRINLDIGPGEDIPAFGIGSKLLWFARELASSSPLFVHGFV